MTVTSTTLKTIAQGNGATTVFSYNFLIPAATQVQVTYTDALGNQTVLTTSQYTITGIGAAAGGTVTYPLTGPAIASGTSLTIMRNLPLTQTKQITNQGAFYPQTVSDALDFIVMQLQQINDEFARALLTPVTEPSTNLTIPTIAQRKNQLLGFDGSGNAIAAQPSSALVSSAMQPVVSAATLALGRTALGLGVLATLGIGAGLRNDGASNLQASSVVSAVATNQAPVAADHRTQFFATGALTFTLARANTLWSGYEFTAFALTDTLTLTPNASDTVYGGASGGSILVPVGTQIRVWTNAAASGTWYYQITTIASVAPQGYLSNLSGTPIIPWDVASATSIYYNPLEGGNSLPIYNGVIVVPYVFNSQLVLALNAVHLVSQIYDVFATIQNGVVVLATGPAWKQPGLAVTGATNASPISVTATAHGLATGDVVTIQGVLGNLATNGTWTITKVDANTFTLNTSTGNGAYTTATGFVSSRGNGANTTQLTRLASQGGLWVNAVAMTGRNGSTNYTIAANQATYLGSILVDSGAAGQVTCHRSYGQNRKFGVWNAYNRKPIELKIGDGTASWTYNSATFRSSDGAAGNSGIVFIGLPEESFLASFKQKTTVALNSQAAQLGIGYQSTTVVSGVSCIIQSGTTVAGFISMAMAEYLGNAPPMGAVTISCLESGTASAPTFTGTEASMVMTLRYRG